MSIARFNDVRYLGGHPELTRFVRGALHVSVDGVTLWSSTVGGGRLMIARDSVRSCEVLPAEAAKDRLSELALTAKPGGGTFLIISGLDSVRLVFEIVTDFTVDEVRDQLASRLPGVRRQAPSPRSAGESSVAGSSPTARFDLTDMTRKDRAAIGAGLVAREIPHGWDGTTLLVPSHHEGSLTELLADLGPAPDRKRPTRVRQPAEASPAAMAEQVVLLERLVSLRDAGVLTPAEYEKARARAAQAIAGTP